MILKYFLAIATIVTYISYFVALDCGGGVDINTTLPYIGSVLGYTNEREFISYIKGKNGVNHKVFNNVTMMKAFIDSCDKFTSSLSLYLPVIEKMDQTNYRSELTIVEYVESLKQKYTVAIGYPSRIKEAVDKLYDQLAG